MKITILGAGPAGLYCGLLMKKAYPTYDITILERNPRDVTYGWGVVFSDRTLASFQRADYKTYEEISGHFVIWDAIDVHYRDATIRCGGHIIASIGRKQLLNILQRRCAELGITLKFNHEVHDVANLGDYDVLIAADGINSVVRKTYASFLKPEITPGKAKYIWLGTTKVLDAFTFIFRENEHGLFQVHAYPSSGTTSTFIVECDEQTWLHAGLDTANEATSIAYCEQLFAGDLGDAGIISNNSKWISFPTLKTENWHHNNIVLLGDAIHTAHFSIGSGTKLAMEDAIALASALEQHSNIEAALNAYEIERKPVVEIFQKAAQESQTYFETIKRYLNLDPMQFTFQLLTRSGRISYDDLRLRDPRYGDSVDRWYAQKASAELQTIGQPEHTPAPIIGQRIAPPPLFAPLQFRSLTLSNRVIAVADEYSDNTEHPSQDSQIDTGYKKYFTHLAFSGVGLVKSSFTAVSSDGRITPHTHGLYEICHAEEWQRIVEMVHAHSSAKLAIQLGHAGRRGATRLRDRALDRPLREGAWPLLSASSIPYTPVSQIPKEMDKDDLERVCDDFVRATRMADEVGFDLLQLHYAHGYLLASFLSPLTNQRTDEYGGTLEQWMRFPLAVFDAVRAVWPTHKPISVAISATDCVPEGSSVDDAVVLARTLKAHGCDIIEVLAGQTTLEGEPPYGRGFLTPLSDLIRNEASISTIVGGYLTTTNEINTILAAGRADLCILEQPIVR
ncbi:MAG TPA: FAD-dependent monooxygenase [Ktedonobacteraceae bacterium]|nr:FAD-dependent monooxygenase [Ktedonobacteraceae bacterium]